jgi:magnesium-transporting ATPase (P-type)
MHSLSKNTVISDKLAEFLADESQMTGESNAIKKTPENYPHEGATPFLISGSKINDGAGFAMVLAVGIHSQLGILRASLETEEPDTPLQLKLTDLAEMIGTIGMWGAGLTVLGCTLGLVITTLSDENVLQINPARTSKPANSQRIHAFLDPRYHNHRHGRS